MILLVSPLAQAAPPPGDAEVTNQICSTWGNGNGICDDYSSELDSTIDDEWIEGHVMISMEGASSIEMSLELAIHEIPRDELGLNDLDLEGDSNLFDGIPADYIRNYRDFSRDGLSVQDRLIDTVGDIVQQIVDENFPNATTSPLQPTTEISFSDRQGSSCTFNPDIDSIDEENGVENNPFQPPICLQSVLILEVNPANIGMTPETGDIDRAMQGLMVMGGEVTTNFTTIAASGQYIEYSLYPPSYADIVDVNEPAEIFSSLNGLQQLSGVRISLDNLNGTPDVTPATSDLVAVLGNGGDIQDSDMFNGPSLSLDLQIDLSDGMNSRVDLEIGVHHLSAETLNQWGLNLETPTIKLDSVTSDGIRMLNSEMDIDVNQILSSLPINSLSESFSQSLGVDVAFQTPSFSSTNDSGGIMFLHRPGETCEEEQSYRYCLGLSGAMSSTYPITIQSSTIPSEISISSILASLIQYSGGDVSTVDLSKMNDEDLATMMSFLSVELEVDGDFIHDFLPSNFPPSEITMTIQLPEWLESIGSGPESLVFSSKTDESTTRNIEFSGSRPFDWMHSICRTSDPCEEESVDLVCAPTQKTCISFLVEIDISKVSIQELSGTVSVEFTSEIILEIYRLGVDLEIDGVQMSPIPSDAIRRILVMGDRIDGGLLADSTIESTIDFGVGDPIDFELSNGGLRSLSNHLTNSYSQMMNDFGEIYLDSSDIGLEGISLTADLSSMPFEADFEAVSIREGPVIGDKEPIRLSTKVNNAELTLSLRQDEVIVGVNPRSISAIPSLVLSSLFPQPIITDSGLMLDGSNIRQKVTPLMEHTNFGTIKSSAYIEIMLPESIKITSFESEKGLGKITNSGDRQVFSYTMPTCLSAVTWEECSSKRNSDIVTYSVEFSWGFMIGELAPYIFFLAVSLSLLVSRARRKRRERKAELIRRSKDIDNAKIERLMENEFGKLSENTALVDETDFEEHTEIENGSA